METMRLARMFPLVLIPTFLCCAQSSPAPVPVTSRFVGNWKENEARRKLSSAPLLTFRVTADGGLEELRGGPAPAAQPIHFDGKPYDAGSGNTIIWKQSGRNQFERQFFSGGQLASARRIQISNAGKTLTETTERKQPDGKISLITAVFTSNSGTGSGLAGIWSLQSIRSDQPEQVTLSAAGPNSLRYANSQGVTYTAALDNKPVPVTGPGVMAGSMIALIRLLDDYTIASTLSRNGVVTGSGTITVSPDGKVMTTTVTNAGPNANPQPSVRVWDRK
jgi:hypothetical protein